MFIIEAVTDLVGAIPTGYEIVGWIMASVILIFLASSCFSIIANMFKIFIRE